MLQAPLALHVAAAAARAHQHVAITVERPVVSISSIAERLSGYGFVPVLDFDLRIVGFVDAVAHGLNSSIPQVLHLIIIAETASPLLLLLLLLVVADSLRMSSFLTERAIL